MTVNISRQTISQSLTSPSYMQTSKLSPSSVACEPNLPSIDEKNSSKFRLDKEQLLTTSQHNEHDRYNLNVPPLMTPMRSRPITSADEDAAPSLPPKTAPQLPVLPKPQRRPRSASESDACISNRRTLFGNYWNNRTRSNSFSLGAPDSFDASDHQRRSNPSQGISDTSPPPGIHKRSSSLSMIEGPGLFSSVHDYRSYAPPKSHAARSPICARFASVDEVPMNSSLDSLPPLPAPLKRLCSGNNSPGCLGGMYPLVTPVSILRPSSFRKNDAQDAKPSNNNQKSVSFSSDTEGPSVGAPSDGEASVSGASVTSTDSGSQRSGVRFDPRVTISEFEDAVERCWYSDMELDMLKQETLRVAQGYLMTHSEQAELYSQETLDPVTGSLRRKALYAMPVLSEVEDDTLGGASDGVYQILAKAQVRNILIVDPNRAILDLFCRSMHSMFPTAHLDTTQSSEQALTLVASRLESNKGTNNKHLEGRHYDIVIVEQRLCTAPRDLGSAAVRTGSHLTMSDRVVSELQNIQHIPLAASKPVSFIEGAGVSSSSSSSRFRKPSPLQMNIAGDELLRRIGEMEAQAIIDKQESLSSSSSASSDKNKSANANNDTNDLGTWRSLFIGVSMQPDHDAKILRQAGADVIWGKPIPKVGPALRNQLLKELIKKRRPAVEEDDNEDTT